LRVRRVTFYFGVLAALATLALLAGCGGEASTPTATAVQSTPTAVTPANPTAMPTAASTAQGSTGAEDTPIPVTDGGTISAGQTGTTDDVKITLDRIRHTDQGAIAPMSGYEYIVLKLTYENDNSYPVSVGSFWDDVTVRDAAGKTYKDTGMAALTSKEFGNNLAVDSATLNPKGKHTGELGLEVPKDATGLVVDYQLTTADPTGALRRGILHFKLDR
jgi:hypothetical protein